VEPATDKKEMWNPIRTRRRYGTWYGQEGDMEPDTDKTEIWNPIRTRRRCGT
jgi:hypothetical protein